MDRRGRGCLAVLAALLAPACSAGGDGAVSDVRWDLREPTTTRQLGGEADLKHTVAATGEELLDVEIELPGFAVRGRWDMATATAFNADDRPTVDTITLYDRDVTALDELRDILRRFERAWGFTAEDCAEIGPFLADAETRMAAAGGDPIEADWGLTQAVSFDGPARGGVTPALVVRLPPTSFSTYTVLAWDPAAEVRGERPVVDVGGPGDDEAPAADSCVPPAATG